MMKTFVSCLLLFLIFSVSACKEEAKPIQEPPPPLVSVMPITKTNMPVYGEFVGQTEGSRAVEVRAQVSGILKKSSYDEGGYVTKGQVLLEIDPEPYQLVLAQAEGTAAQVQAQFIEAEKNWKRISNLYKRNAVSQRERDAAQATYNSAKADLDSANAAADEARVKLGYASVTAPVSGYAGKLNRSVGNLINADSASENLLTVVNQVDPIYVNYAISSPKYMRMRTLHQEGRLTSERVYAKIRLADNSTYPVEGEVIFTDKAVNPNTSVVSARASFVNRELFVLPGQFVRITLYGPILQNAILIPQQAVIQTQQGSMVVVVNEKNIAEMRPVELGDNLGNWFLLEKGLNEGERIVFEGNNKAVPNKPVRIDSKTPPPKLPESLPLLS